MAESLLYVIFKDTCNGDAQSKEIAIENIAAQLQAAAERIAVDPSAIYSYLKQETSVSKDEPITVQVNPTPIEAELVEVGIPPVLDESQIMDIVFKDLKRTQKSLSIIKYLIQNSGVDLTVDQIAIGASVTKLDLSSWLSMTGTKIPAIVRVSRGCYRFNPNNLKIT
jgi:hypothetical protein